jgi:hypothetical protein
VSSKAVEELIGGAQEWDRAMVENDAEAIARFMADDWTVPGCPIAPGQREPCPSDRRRQCFPRRWTRGWKREIAGLGPRDGLAPARHQFVLGEQPRAARLLHVIDPELRLISGRQDAY